MYIGIADVQAELRKDYRSFKINTLCTRDSGGVTVVCFNKACPLVPFAKSFYVITNRLNSSIFLTIWSDTLNLAMTKNPDFGVQHLHSNVWTPVLQQCQTLLDNLYEQTITLGDIDKHFGRYDTSNLLGQLKLLFHGVNECTNKNLDDKWIVRPVGKIFNYWQLCGYREAANSFLKLKDVLELSKGDFSDVERISKKVKHHIYFYNRWKRSCTIWTKHTCWTDANILVTYLH